MITYNSISKLANRTVSELDGLIIGLFEISNDSTRVMLSEETKFNSNDNYNTFDRYTRPIDSYQGLLISVFEVSRDSTQINFNKVKLIKPKKTYTNKIKLIKKYNNKTLY